MYSKIGPLFHRRNMIGRALITCVRRLSVVISVLFLVAVIPKWLFRLLARRQCDSLRNRLKSSIIVPKSTREVPGVDRRRSLLKETDEYDDFTDEIIKEDDLSILRRTKVFTALDAESVAELHQLMEPLKLGEGEALFKAGQPSNIGMYVVTSGTIGISTEDALSKGSVLYEVGTGDDICLHSLFSEDDGSTQTVYAFAVHGSAECLFLPRLAFKLYCIEHAAQLDTLIRVIVGRNWRLMTQVLTSYLSLPALTKKQAQGDDECAMVDLTEERLKSVLDGVVGFSYETISLEPGQVLFEMGDPVHACYILQSGLLKGSPTSVKTGQSTTWSHTMNPSSVVGLMSFMTGSKRGETITAVAESKLVRISKDLYSHLLRNQPQIVVPLLWAAGMQLSALTAEFFSLGLHSIWYKGGSVISPSQEGSNPSMYLVISGRVRVAYIHPIPQREFGQVRKQFFETTTYLDRDSIDTYQDLSTDFDRALQATSVGRGETFGESRTFSTTNSPKHRLHAICERDTELVAMSKETLRNIMLKYPTTIVPFTEIMSRRLSQLETESMSNRKARSERNLKTISFVPAGSTSPREVGAFVLRLAASLSDQASTLLLNSQRLSGLVGRDVFRRDRLDSELSKLSLWLAQQEESYRFVLLETDGGPDVTFWDSFCIRQSDCIVLVGRQGSLSTPQSYEQRLLNFPKWRKNGALSSPISGPPLGSLSVHCTIAILHSDWTEIPANTSSWLNDRNVKSWHHIRVNYESDYLRFCRYLSGTSIGLVLGGGGARGLAHLGVIRAVHDAGISIDCIGGTSQGAFMGALYAASNADLTRMEPVLRSFAAKFGRMTFMKAATFPILSFSNGYSFSRAVRDAIGVSVQIEDLWIPYFTIATNVGRSNSSAAMKGPLWKLVRASMSILGLLPPVIHNGDVLVDGGYSNNLPVDVMNKVFCPQTVIAVDVEDRNNDGLIGLYDYGDGVSGWWILLQKLNPFNTRKIPQFYDILSWLNCINHNRQLRMLDREMIDIYVRPNIHSFGLLEYHRLDEIVQAGYDAATESIQKWELANAESERHNLSHDRGPHNLIKSRSAERALNPKGHGRGLFTLGGRIGSLPPFNT